MGVFDKFNDAPNQIKKEGQEIVIRFQRTGPTTGRISWNIPASVAGCSTGSNAAYDGIVITVSSKPANYLSTSPKNGVYYTGDATVNSDIHAGDAIDGSLVLAALYHDRTTTFIDVTDVTERTPYYVSGYAVDGQGRYHREGVHAYSLPTGSEEWGGIDKVAKHDIIIDVTGGIDPSTVIGIDERDGLPVIGQQTLKVKLGKKTYDIVIDNADLHDYADLISVLTERLTLLDDSVTVTNGVAPHTGTYYLNLQDRTLKEWTGTSYDYKYLLITDLDPQYEVLGTYWYNPTTKVLKILSLLTGEWEVADYITGTLAAWNADCGLYWLEKDGSDYTLWLKNGTHWEKLNTYVQARNPLLAPLLTCDDYWYNPATGIVAAWNPTLRKWEAKNVIYSAANPNSATYWYDETTEVVKQWTTQWDNVAGVLTVETLPDDDAESVGSGYYYVYVKDTGKLFRLNVTTWAEETSLVNFDSNPRDRTTSIYWWDKTSDVLSAWDALTEAWLAVASFAQGLVDPSLPPKLIEHSGWYNPETGEIKIILSNSCGKINPIISTVRPDEIPDGMLFLDTVTNLWYQFDSGDLVLFNDLLIMDIATNPYDIDSDDYYWYNPTTEVLSRRFFNTLTNQDEWETVVYSTTPVSIAIDSYWYDDTANILYRWTGSAWVEADPIAGVELIQPDTADGRSVVSFYTRGAGCSNYIEVLSDPNLLFSNIIQPIIWTDPESGADGRVGGSMANQLGVGDDGSPDERRAMHTDIRVSLGDPAVKVELTKEQIDLCINLALKQLRKYSSFSYKRAFFFLDLKPNQQKYLLTNKCVGFNKVVGINSIHRMRGNAMSMAALDNSMFAHAAIQKLFSTGTFDMLSFHLVSSYMEELETLFANRIMFNWHEFDRELSLFSGIHRKERVLVDAYFERSEQDLMLDRHTSSWLQRWALAEAKLMLSQTRGKFQTLAGPNGSTTLNASDLQSQASEEKTLLQEQLEDGSMQDFSGLGMRAHFMLG
jgi:hypothetical protein